MQPKQITSGRFDEGNAIWTKDGSRIYFASTRVDEPYYELPRLDLFSIPPEGGEPTKITTILEYETPTFTIESSAFTPPPNA